MRNAKLIFWDFDGVIKDTIEVKTKAFIVLFESYGSDIVALVKRHHEANGGMSRFDKIPMYMQWAGEKLLPSNIQVFQDQFSQLVFQAVIDSPWVPGAEDFLKANLLQQIFVLVSATPQNELEEILKVLDLTNCFNAIYGAPNNKTKAIGDSLAAFSLDPKECLMIGDSEIDHDAAMFNQVPFLLRSHDNNSKLFTSYTGPSLKNFVRL
jgi:phosphoglycolate phosphatase-like HAD superfamily hydrolase